MNVSIEILNVDITPQPNLCIIFQGQHQIELGEYEEKRELSIFCPTWDDDTLYLSAFIGRDIFKRESSYTEHHLKSSQEFSEADLIFNKDSLFPINGKVRIKYKCQPISNSDKVRFQEFNSFLFSLSIDYLNTLFEPPLETVIQIYNSFNILITKALVTNSMHTLLFPISNLAGEGGLTLFFTEKLSGREIPRSYRMSLFPLQTVIYSIPTTTNKIVVAEVNLWRKRESLPGMYHSAVLREGRIVADGQRGSRISLTPRRSSSINTALHMGNMSARQSLAGSVKYILYINDESISVHHDSFGNIAANILRATAITTKDIQLIKNGEIPSNVDDPNQLGAGRLHGTFLACSSKSEVIEGAQDALPKKGKNKRKALQNVCLGIVKLDRSYLNGPLKLCATIVKVEFQITTEVTSEGVFDASKPLEYEQHKSVFFTGTIKESSREIFSDTGLLSCTLEGTLFRPDENANHEVSGSNPPSPRRDGELCMAFKVYMSLINCESSERPLDAESSLDTNEEDDNTATDKIMQEEVSKQAKEREIQQQATTEGTKFNETKGNEDDGELPGHSNVNVPAIDPKSLMEEFKAAAKSPSVQSLNQSASKKTLSKQQSEEKEIKSSIVPQLSLDKLQQGSREKLQLNGLPLNMDNDGESNGELTGDEATFLPGSSSNKQLLSTKASKSSLPEPPEITWGQSETQTSHSLLPIQQPQAISNHNYAVGLVKPQNAFAFAEMVREQLAEKQRMIEKLLKELDDKYEAIQLCGKDIRHLREEKFQLQGQIKDLQGAVSENYEAEKDATEMTKTLLADDSITVDSLLNEKDNKTLLRAIKKLQTTIQTQEQDRIKLDAQIARQQEEIERLKVIEAASNDVKLDHDKLNRYVQYIDKDIAKIDLYRRTIKTQEKMMARLQNVMESKLKSKFTALRAQANRFSFDAEDEGQDMITAVPPKQQKHGSHHRRHNHKHKDDVSVNPEESNTDTTSELEAKQASQIIEMEDKILLLEDQLAEAQQQMQVQETQIRDLTMKQKEEEQQAEVLDDDDDDDIEKVFDPSGRRPAKFTNVKKANLKIDQLVAESLSKDFRVSSMEQQLEQSTRASAKEIAHLRTKVFELEMTVSMLSDNALLGGQMMSGDDEGLTGDVTMTDPEAIQSSKHPNISFEKINTNDVPDEAKAPELSHPAAVEGGDKEEVPPPATTAVSGGNEVDLTNLNYEATRRESVVDIDRIPTPPEAK